MNKRVELKRLARFEVKRDGLRAILTLADGSEVHVNDMAKFGGKVIFEPASEAANLFGQTVSVEQPDGGCMAELLHAVTCQEVESCNS